MTIEACLQLLRITSTPTKTGIKRAFRRAALACHPDTKGTDEEFIKIKRAYDKLMKLDDNTLKRYRQPATDSTYHPNDSYDPFCDPDYEHRTFFMPDKKLEDFERASRAKRCKICHGLGHITKNTAPEKGFLGLERRLCKCQWL